MDYKTLSALILSAILLTGCGHIQPPLASCKPLPEELTEPLENLRQPESHSDVLESHFYNMEQCGTCFAKYQALVEAAKGRCETD